MALTTGTAFRALADLAAGERAALRAVVGGHPVFALYLESGLQAADAGDRSRSALIGRAGAGIAMAIDFDDVAVTTVVGRLDGDELAVVCAVGRRTELPVVPGLRQHLLEPCVG